ncbi:hypothetical protein GDO86_008164 [Hymenochirus boettgeri]|uniref:Uncharacterized protein n=1 Tax=Hymenochirus boettgeri TaxID=247094 RepID=A0A8T2J1Y6_9PIPI|nr:hypothetical protein GDO86_008164 [Hymenochirus boettgeri]
MQDFFSALLFLILQYLIQVISVIYTRDRHACKPIMDRSAAHIVGTVQLHWQCEPDASSNGTPTRTSET